MLSLIIVSLVAGVCLAQDSSRYSDCDAVNGIATQCADAYLGYMQDHSEMLKLGMIGTPDFVLPKLDVICNDTMKLKKYYVCALTNVTTCLQEKNSTQEMGLPDANTLATGIVDLCKAREGMNKTCILAAVKKVETCFGANNVQSYDPCSYSKKLVTCAAALSECEEGGEAVKEFINSARPRMCLDGTSSAPHYLPAFLTLIMAMVLAHITVQ